jgi:N utilization substance protein A
VPLAPAPLPGTVTGMDTFDPHTAAAALEQLARERGISSGDLWQGVADALRAAYLRLPGAFDDARLEIHTENFSVSVKRPDGSDVTPEGFGRVGAAVFKRELVSTVARVQRTLALRAFTGRELSIVEGVVVHATDRRATIRIRDLEAVLPRSEQIPGERLRRGQEIYALLVELRPDGDDALLLSRIHPEFLPRLLPHLVPAVNDGRVEVKAVARVPGQRSKVAIFSPLGPREAMRNVVGAGGSVIRSVQRALGPEWIDLVAFDADPVVLTADALELDPSAVRLEAGRLLVAPPEEVRARVIGASGINLRLISQLVGLPIDVVAALPPVEGRR